MSNIHKTAIIEDGAILGENVTIGAYTIIGKNVKIGDGTIVDSNSLITGKTTIGKNNHIFSHASIGSIPQDLKFNPSDDVELIIGDNNRIREFTLFNPGTIGGGAVTKIGNNNLFMGYTHVAHDCIIGDNCIFANGVTLAGHVEVDDFAVVGGLTPVHQFCKIGTQAMVGGASAVAQDIPPFCLAEGNKATIRGLNLVGLRRRLENKEDINDLKSAYRSLFASGKPLQEVAKELFETSKNDLVKELAGFVMNTKRGIPFERTVKSENE
ncbi:acyl-ACP--UDP-N-acetylglucosamine O-acyltransferase [Arcobacter porcinus]|uniref:Acyl-[acyl-carrier-protein]--UDP-N-acetylglucosamine O-acyltransferase n=1 Tax=Arcobacter porcinus TaxID=1935204 RepID=A0A1C0AY47_9BACT|nr:acyl-ACP--UDP-N-acetylglucosamine O-acyltransferase [Arcobacter porcinus]OCL94442.1 Acyl-[acyl-carrier-protein]--UDP-N-acetylglucosamine O-acyltransferase [Aliarcobacter thereius]OCL83040.1 Acyl-[acyl-carrier-protein]--UDP-N-acetylglucosamine O-acyltransferase [Arcobacter porcinus]OCL83469.1 Acyl-[acyl-carrier-protein]--UDP-N-acetylglucosamine O-acyltransferase [Arcobacter porcinus]OCL88245.1 Acyl-[acyl-carrier-protein]--UDP-N-acetylglucosamine O-acyltransferase [Arcobacter porcinus]OCL9247